MLPVALPMAHAEPDYPPSFYKISADTFSGRVGASIAFTGQTFEAGSTVEYAVTAGGATVESGTAQANGSGLARTTITFTVAGTNTVTMTGTADTGKPLPLTAEVQITAAGDDDGSTDGSDNDSGNGNAGGADNGSGNGSGSSAPQAEESSGVPFFGGGLPRTGGDIALTGVIALALIGGGAALVFATRKRHTA